MARFDHIGDFLLWVSTAKYYQEYFADAEIVFFGREEVIKLAEMLPFWNRCIAVEVAPGGELRLKNEEHPVGDFDLVINVQYSRVFLHDKFISSLKSSQKIAVDASTRNQTAEEQARSNPFYTRLLTLDAAPKHELVRNFEILNAITGGERPVELKSLSSYFQTTSDQTGHLPEKYVICFPGSSWHKRSYPWPRIVAAVRMIKDKYGLITILCGSKTESTLGNNIERNARGAVINLAGKLELHESLGLLMKAQFVISNDSMAAHAANFLGRPSICIIGGGFTTKVDKHEVLSGRFLPYPPEIVPPQRQIILAHPIPCQGCESICKYDHLVPNTIPCVDYIPVEDLLKSIDSMYESINRGNLCALLDK